MDINYSIFSPGLVRRSRSDVFLSYIKNLLFQTEKPSIFRFPLELPVRSLSHQSKIKTIRFHSNLHTNQRTFVQLFVHLIIVMSKPRHGHHVHATADGVFENAYQITIRNVKCIKRPSCAKFDHVTMTMNLTPY